MGNVLKVRLPCAGNDSCENGKIRDQRIREQAESAGLLCDNVRI